VNGLEIQIKALLEASLGCVSLTSVSQHKCAPHVLFCLSIFCSTPPDWQFPSFLFMLLVIFICFLLQLNQNFPSFSRLVKIITLHMLSVTLYKVIIT